jgi:alkylation response protein AidB-like acyl-CoA dehydrogenase
LDLDTALSTAGRVADEVAAPSAAAVDRDAAFPAASVAALAEAGLAGLISAPEVGGSGLGLRAAALVVERLARACGSTAMVTCMHYAGTAVIEKVGDDTTRREAASGALATLAFSEVGSRSHFWAPVSTARADGDAIVLDAQKSFATSARHAKLMVWSSKPVAAEAPSTLWLVRGGTPGVTAGAPFDGAGLRGNDSGPIAASGARIPSSARLGADGGGFDLMMGVVLPIFSVMTAGCALGLAESALSGACAHAAATRHEHLGSRLCDLPTIRAYLAKARNQLDGARCLWLDALAALEAGRPDAMLRVLQCKSLAGDTALDVTAAAMRVCGGVAYRRELGVERAHRDAQAASIMAPTSDQLYDFIGKAVTGMPLF